MSENRLKYGRNGGFCQTQKNGAPGNVPGAPLRPLNIPAGSRGVALLCLEHR